MAPPQFLVPINKDQTPALIICDITDDEIPQFLSSINEDQTPALINDDQSPSAETNEPDQTSNQESQPPISSNQPDANKPEFNMFSHENPYASMHNFYHPRMTGSYMGMHPLNAYLLQSAGNYENPGS